MRYYGIRPESLGQLGVLGRQVKECSTKRVELKVEFLRPYGVAYLDQVMLAVRQKREMKLASTYPQVNRYLKQTSFEHLASRAPLGEPFPQNDIIRVTRFCGTPLDVETQVVSWLTECVKPFLPRHSPLVWKKIVENLWEIVHNGIQHGESEYGVSTCGQFYPQMGYFEMAVYDTGHGIPHKVKEFRAKAITASDCECIDWAVQKGNSTIPFEKSAGLGLHLLREFLSINGGIFQIVSGTGYYDQIGNSPSSTTSLKNSIDGTLVNIRVIYDDHLYKMKGERL